MMEHGRTVQERDIGKGSWGSYAWNMEELCKKGMEKGVWDLTLGTTSQWPRGPT